MTRISLQNLGFNFSFYGRSFSQAAISSNGFLTFRPPGTSDASSTHRVSTQASRFRTFKRRCHASRLTGTIWTGAQLRHRARAGSFSSSRPTVLITWNNIRDFPNDPAIDNGVHRFQVTLFSDGRILFSLTILRSLLRRRLQACLLADHLPLPQLVDLSNPPVNVINAPIAEFFSTSQMVDTIGRHTDFLCNASRSGCLRLHLCFHRFRF